MLTPTTELEAVNTLLQIIGEAPVSSLEVSGLADVAIAKDVLMKASREVQAFGWHFNTEEDVSFAPDREGVVYVPSNVLQVSSKSKDVVHRGSRLYDRLHHTYFFDEAVEVDVIYFFGFEEIPEAARHYITIKAGRQFANRMMASGDLRDFTAEDEGMARILLMEAEGETGQYNMLSDSYSVSNILRRE